MKDIKRVLPIHRIIFVPILFLVILILFHWYSWENSRCIEEQNRKYAADSARQIAGHVEDELTNALNRIGTYADFLGKSLSEPKVTAEMLGEMEKKSNFDVFRFADAKGINHAADGQTSDAMDRDYYIDGMKGNSGISIIMDSRINHETMVGFYAPVYYKNKIIGVLRGAYWEKEYMQDMLSASYFGKEAGMFFCSRDGTVIANAKSWQYSGSLSDNLIKYQGIDEETAGKTKAAMKDKEKDSIIPVSSGKIDNICILHLLKGEYMLVQTFPKSITQNMVERTHRIGFLLECMLILCFIGYIVLLLVWERREKRGLERKN